MNYQSKNPDVRRLIDRPRWQEWVEFELEHIAKQIRGVDHDWGTEEMSKLCDETLQHFDDANWRNAVSNGAHEMERLVVQLAEMLNVKYHKYLHRGLTSSNVIDSCNHRRWNRLSGLLQGVVSELHTRSLDHNWENKCVGMTHGRRAHRTSLWQRHAYQFWYNKEQDQHETVYGGPTGESDYRSIHRQAMPRHAYWRMWAWIAQVAYGCEQVATDHRFYCSDLSEAVGVRGTLAPGVATTSSAMPGKVNPTVFERVCSVGYMVRTMCTAQMLQPPKWLDADLVHSALERETIDRIWDYTFWLVEEMTRLVNTTKLEVTRETELLTSFDALQEAQEHGLEYSLARETAAKRPTG